jgi:hypothetical protein
LAAGVDLASELVFLGRFLDDGGVCIIVDRRNLRILSSLPESSRAKASSANLILSSSSFALARSA